MFLIWSHTNFELSMNLINLKLIQNTRTKLIYFSSLLRICVKKNLSISNAFLHEFLIN